MKLSAAKIDYLIQLAKSGLKNLAKVDHPDLRAYRNLQVCLEELAALKRDLARRPIHAAHAGVSHKVV